MQQKLKRGVVLNVPYAEKDEAKDLGARWDPDLRKWFVPEGSDIRPFSRWFEPEADFTEGKGR